MILNTHIMVLRHLENFLQPFEIQKYPQKQLVALTFTKFSGAIFSFWEGMKSKKLPSPHVVCFRIRLRRCAIMPFAFATYYDPKQLPPSTGGDTWSSRKFFQNSRSNVYDPPNPIFCIQLELLVWFYLKNMNETSKMAFSSRFVL